MKNYLINIVGPTAIGKTALSLALSRHFSCAVISSDSRQFYREMRIGTAVPDPDELAQAKHFFIQNRSIHEEYSVGMFEKDALAVLDKLYRDNNFAVMVGGSGLYADAVLKGLDYFPKPKPGIREKLQAQLAEEGISALQAQLEHWDPVTYKRIDLNNPQRVIRALEVCLSAEKPYSYYKNKPKEKRRFTSINIGLHADRAILYQRIEERVDNMMRSGLLEEARSLYKYRHLNALQTVGYKELFAYFDGAISLDFAVSEIKKNTRRFAKRQLTWYRKKPDILWFDYQTDVSEIIRKIREVCK